ncbi:MAG: regulatory iron-sulfur-containing complex subunit RicT [Planctomycetota bacterium]
MPIAPLPQFEADLAQHLAEQADREAYERLNAPKTIVVRFGTMKLVGEFPYKGEAKPGCGSKIVVRTHRGTEIGEMLTSTCANSGCSKSVSRKEMLEYIENSGGRQYPFFSKGRALRIATKEDMDDQARLEQGAHEMKMEARRIAEAIGAPVKVIEAEPILGGERLTFYYGSEDRPDVGELRRRLEARFSNRVDLRQVGARDEARLTADYERCGQYCCCKNFLKVLKPVSMKSAKTQRQTLDPLKISGRCGRLMCCLRYEDETYEELRKRLPRRGSRVGTPEGSGEVVDSQLLTQLVLVRLEGDGREVAVPVEELGDPGEMPQPRAAQPREARPREVKLRGDDRKGGERDERRPPKRRRPERAPSPAGPGPAPESADAPASDAPATGVDERSPRRTTDDAGDAPVRKKKRRRRRKPTGQGEGAQRGSTDGPSSPDGGTDGARDSSAGDPSDAPRPKKKRRRRRKPPPGGGGPPSGPPSGPESGPPPSE